MKSLQFLFKTALFVLALLLPSVALAYDFEVDGIYYNIIGNEASVTYQGDDAYSGDIVIPEFVTHDGVTYSVIAIEDLAFSDSEGLTSIEIPNSVIEIGHHAFWNCHELKNVEIPSSVETIGSFAFGNCYGFTSITIPSSVRFIGEGTFNGCIGVTSIIVDGYNPYYNSYNDCNAIIETPTDILIAGCKKTIIPSFVSAIANRAFEYCPELVNIEIPNSVTSIGDGAFNGCFDLSSLVIPNSVTTIGEGAFAWCVSIENIVIPNSITTISNWAFRDCYSLTDLTIPKSVTSIGQGAFFNCGLTSILIPESVTQMGDDAFLDNSSLSLVTCYALTPPSITYYHIYGNNVFSFDNATLEVPPVAVSAYQNHEYWGQFHTIQAIETLAGDLDANGNISVADVANLIDLLIEGNSTLSATDVNGDNKFTVADIAELIDQLFADGGN